MKVKRAIISVSDKRGLKRFVKGLAALGVEIISTGGTERAIRSLGVKVRSIESYTAFPEMLDGRVKTLHPAVHAGILALRGKRDQARQMRESGFGYIDMVVVNLYPFEETIAKRGVTPGKAAENIDIGGPAMLRAAAKNFGSVAAVSSPSQYDAVLKELRRRKCALSKKTLRSLAAEVFRKTSSYDGAIAGYLAGAVVGIPSTGGFPEKMRIDLVKASQLRYGENPHQKGVFYAISGSKTAGGLADAVKLWGKELSFNNIMDLDAAAEIAADLVRPGAVIVKHANPCGAAEAATPAEAFIDALECDRSSTFGGVVALNRAVSAATARTILKELGFFECIIAPGYEKAALKLLKRRKNLRILVLDVSGRKRSVEPDFKKVLGGMLVQERDSSDGASLRSFRTVTKAKVPARLASSLLFAWKMVRHVKSNAVLLAKDAKTVGIGAGQASRVDSVVIAARKAKNRARGSALASDAFLPMPDSVEEAARAGVAAIIQPGGSIRDKEVIASCDRYGIAMVFTGIRHFKH